MSEELDIDRLLEESRQEIRDDVVNLYATEIIEDHLKKLVTVCDSVGADIVVILNKQIKLIEDVRDRILEASYESHTD